ncbi:glycosyltransferase family 4 protein [Geminicoccaceae bacterium 1502E]|nr:glycosyltransferase family 4 protein [Geminicoccaceae bacterium 1502E]
MTTTPPPPRRRVLMVSRVGFLGGVERIMLTLAGGLQAHGWDAVLACPPEGALARAARGRCLEMAPSPFDRMRISANPLVLGHYPLAWLRGARSVERHCRQHGIDLIHVHHPVTALYARRASRALGIPMILHVHETLPARPLYAAAMRAVVGHAAAVLCVSQAARALAQALGADAARTQVVHNGIDARFLTAGEPFMVPEPLQNAGPGPHVGIFGMLEPRKAQHVLLEAAALLAGRFPTARFWLVGTAALRDKQGYARELARQAAAPPLQGRVRLVGFQADVAPWLAAMDVVVQTSVAYESFGMALAEAMALGRPVVGSRAGGIPEVIGDGLGGSIVPPGDPAALAAALAPLLGSPDLRRELGKKAAAAARRRFAPGMFCDAVARVYEAAVPHAASRGLADALS